MPNFYFGCEADDRLVAWAFNERCNPLGARLRPIFGSDISHWDVPDMTEPVEEAYELVEDGLIGESDFRELMFLNPARLHAGMNPAFFDGTVCERSRHAGARRRAVDDRSPIPARPREPVEARRRIARHLVRKGRPCAAHHPRRSRRRGQQLRE